MAVVERSTLDAVRGAIGRDIAARHQYTRAFNGMALELTRQEAEEVYDTTAFAFSDDGTLSERAMRFLIEGENKREDVASMPGVISCSWSSDIWAGV